MNPPPDRDAAAAVAMLRDLADAVTEVAGRLFDLPAIPAIPGPAGDATTGRKITMGIGNNSWGEPTPGPDKGKGGIGNSAWSNRKANQDGQGAKGGKAGKGT